ncbi:hypothetical protein AIOL_002557 [Candidatus Rhodobacter oscarellae]|uniref:Uncharacterized protein n=1 Tax=Candidatus Rhodobacter oscarellae TaxID=1675527 RepID=A0A0J9E4D6_9RHOB|nr:hypothetical protein AIOL_002557 [Candidatus Rhodobacter lobularis]
MLMTTTKGLACVMAGGSIWRQNAPKRAVLGLAQLRSPP